MTPELLAGLDALLDLPGVADGVQHARDACTGLRWHPAMRRRQEEVRAECAVRAAQASARLDGARVELVAVRAAFQGTEGFGTDAEGATARGAVRAVAEADRLARAWQGGQAPALPRALSRLHVAAAAGLVPDRELGRPVYRGPAAARLRDLAALLAAPASAPALLLAAIAHAELVAVQPFPTGTGVVARALARAVTIGRGLDPMGAAVWERGLVDAGGIAAAALAGYPSGEPAAVAAWLTCWSSAMVAGVVEATAAADAVLAGRLPAA